MDVRFITFGDGKNQFREAAQRLATQARETGWFTESTAFHHADLGRISPAWLSAHEQQLLSQRRGYGYWIWKPFLMFETLKRMPADSFLVCADAGYEISPHGGARFQQYLEMAAEFNLLGFHIGERISKWTKGDLLDHFGFDARHPMLEENQYQSGLLFIKKTYANVMFLSHWAELAVAKNYSLINDAPSLIANPEGFAEHRHDQAILTLLAKCQRVGHWPMSEDYHPELFGKGQYIPGYPFQCFRNPTGERRIPR